MVNIDDSEGFSDTHVAPLSDDRVPDINQSHYCFSCESPMHGLYCAQCGQKNDNMRRSIFGLLFEFIGSVTALEGRILRSLYSLFLRPGQMSRDYADGARQKWTSPVRLYLAASLLLFGYIALSNTQLIAFGNVATTVVNEEPAEDGVAWVTVEDKKYMPKVYFLERMSVIRANTPSEAIKALQGNLNSFIGNNEDKSTEDLQTDFDNLQSTIAELSQQIEATGDGPGVAGLVTARDELVKQSNRISAIITERTQSPESTPETTTADEPTTPGTPDTNTVADSDNQDSAANPGGGSNFRVTGWRGQEINLDSASFGEVLALALENPQRLNAPIGNYLPKIMFLMMPFSMLMGAIFVRSRQNAMLYDHLVHAAYIHAFSFLLLLIFILLVQFTPLPGLLLAYSLILLVYLPISAKRMFQRGWFKTILVSYGVGFVYTCVMGAILIILVLQGFLDIAAEVSAQNANEARG